MCFLNVAEKRFNALWYFIILILYTNNFFCKRLRIMHAVQSCSDSKPLVLQYISFERHCERVLFGKSQGDGSLSLKNKMY